MQERERREAAAEERAGDREGRALAREAKAYRCKPEDFDATFAACDGCGIAFESVEAAEAHYEGAL